MFLKFLTCVLHNVLLSILFEKVKVDIYGNEVIFFLSSLLELANILYQKKKKTTIILCINFERRKTFKLFNLPTS